MKQLYLIRHAKSSWKEAGLRDFDRPLNPRGETDAPLVGSWLHQQGILPDAIISSPANRAITTAQKIAAQVNFPPEQIIREPEIYEADVETLFQIIRFLDDGAQTIFLVGHNPGFTQLANYLAAGQVTGNIPTCGVVALQFPVASWRKISPHSGELLWYCTPKQLKK
ncbi:MAG: histidine phosphatase family protein [Gemmatimonadetes bacterium]|nr:MAG: histidine phosphatase family protein [Gemmatimonadota bacterium]